MSYIPAPGAAVLAVDGTTLKLGATATELVPGVGITAFADPTARTLQLEGQTADPTQPSGLYLPAIAAAVDRAKFTQRSRDGRSFLQVIDANCDQAPVGANALNHIAVRIRGAQGGQQDLAIINRYSTWSGWDAVLLGSAVTASGDGQPWGYGTQVTPTAELTVRTITIKLNGGGIATEDGFVEVSIRSAADRSVVLAKGRLYGPRTTDLEYAVPLDRAITLAQGVPVFVAWQGQKAQFGAVAYGASAAVTGSLTGATNLRKLMDYDAGWGSAAGDVASAAGAWFRLNGSPGGALLSGDLTVDLVSVGAPPAYSGGVNIRFAFAATRN